MKPRSLIIRSLLPVLALLHPAAHGETFIWNKTMTSTGTENWTTLADWTLNGGTPGVVPGVLDTADFSNMTLPNKFTVVLDGNQSINALIFANGGAAYNWVLTRSGT